MQYLPPGIFSKKYLVTAADYFHEAMGY